MLTNEITTKEDRLPVMLNWCKLEADVVCSMIRRIHPPNIGAATDENTCSKIHTPLTTLLLPKLCNNT